jgi:hypothetical protein
LIEIHPGRIRLLLGLEIQTSKETLLKSDRGNPKTKGRKEDLINILGKLYRKIMFMMGRK